MMKGQNAYRTAGCLILLVLSAPFFISKGQSLPLPGQVYASETANRSDFVFEEPNLPQPEKTEPLQERETDCTSPQKKDQKRPRIAIIIDDMGYHEQIGNSLLALPLDLTFSFLPHAPFSLQQEETAFQHQRDILIHMPMEAQDPTWNLGPGALYLSSSPAEIIATVQDNVAAIPHAIGASNHMGSRFTEDRESMHLVLDELHKQGLFFIDSVTTSQTIGMEEARKIGIPAAARHVFLDNDQDEKKICRQLEQLIIQARKKSWAIGIGHPNQATLTALTDCRERLLDQVDIVGVHHLLNPAPTP